MEKSIGISDLIKAIGGRKFVASTVGVTTAAINMWVYNGSIPAKHYESLIEIGKSVELDFDQDYLKTLT